jgi:hypothetical protein
MQKEDFIKLRKLSNEKICILCRKQRDGKTVRIGIARSAHLGSFDFHVCNKCVRRKSPKIKKIAVAILLTGTIVTVILTIAGFHHTGIQEIQFAPISLAAIIAVCILAEQGSLNARRNNLALDYLAMNGKAEDIQLYVITDKGLRDSRFSRYMPYEDEKIKKENEGAKKA